MINNKTVKAHDENTQELPRIQQRTDRTWFVF